jgi:hypothetical protein
MTDAIPANAPANGDNEINVHLGIDFFIPGCFNLDACLTFEDPLQSPKNSQAETDRLNALVTVNLANADRGFVPGNVVGQPQANTPSLRGIWYQGNFLRHGLAHSLKEAILAPGHPLLAADKNNGVALNGFAVDSLGTKDVHGVTSTMSEDDFNALNLFVQTIE